MKYVPKEPVRRARWLDYVAAGIGLVAVAGLVVVIVSQVRHPYRPPPKTAPVGFSSEWQCIGASTKGGGFCWRNLPPAQPRKP